MAWRNWKELAGTSYSKLVYVFAFHAFETSILWSTIVFWKLYCSNVYLCSIHYQKITLYVELFFQICQAHFSFLRHLIKCWFLKLLTMLKNLVYKGNRCHFLMDCNSLALSRAMLLEYYWSQRREPLFDSQRRPLMFSTHCLEGLPKGRQSVQTATRNIACSKRKPKSDCLGIWWEEQYQKYKANKEAIENLFTQRCWKSCCSITEKIVLKLVTLNCIQLYVLFRIKAGLIWFSLLCSQNNIKLLMFT